MMTSHWAEPPFRYFETPRVNGYAVAWRKLRNMTRMLRFKWQLRHVDMLATRCGTCVRRPGRRHRPCYALECQCPCSREVGPVLHTVRHCVPASCLNVCGRKGLHTARQISPLHLMHATYAGSPHS
jgi:hypothetical protein